MKQQSFTNTLTVDQTPEQVFNTVNNPRAWWNENIGGATDRRGSRFHYAYRTVHTSDMIVEEFVPYSRVVWLVEDNHFDHIKDDSEWKGTRVVFEIARHGDKTVLTFTHVGLVPDYECYELCEKAWTFFTGDSLYKLITTGVGDPIEVADATVEPLAGSEDHDGNLTLSFMVEQSPTEVFEAVTNVRGWWSAALEGESAKLGDEFVFSYEDIHTSKHRLVEVIPDRRVVWLTLDASLNFVDDKHEWIGTRAIFDIRRMGLRTELRFTHEGLKPELLCYEGCKRGWSFFILESLRSLITTGAGDPAARAA